jgi:DNA-binding Lrp family transcriptional regulator
VKAYIFVHAAAGKVAAVARELAGTAGVTSADMCWGVPDIIAVVDAPDAKALQKIVLDRIQKIGGVNQTDTHVVSES